MIQVSNLSKHYGPQVLYENLSFVLGTNEKIGFVGRNGSGKTTLFRLIQGQESIDSGVISIPKNYIIGSLDQHIKFTKKSVLEECCQNLEGEEQFDFYKAEKILFGLGFTQSDMQKSPDLFSGGYQVRINLAKLLLSNPNLLLLDEPTNYLDIVSLRWLKRFLRSFPGEFILITHDRDFMNDVTTHTMGLVRRQLKKIKGDTKKFFFQLEQEDNIYESTLKNQEKKRKDMEAFVTRFKAKASKATQAQSRVKMLEKMETLEELENEATLGFKFNHIECPGKLILSTEHLSFSYDGKKEHFLFDDLSFSVGRKDRIAIIGKNGKGKSTLLNILAGELKPVKGSLTSHPSLKTSHFGQMNVQRLNEEATIIDEITSSNLNLSISNVRNICGTMMFAGEMAAKKIKVLSGGERSRVLLGKIIANSSNLLLLDEPNNHLDMESCEVLADEINAYKGAVVLVTHNEMILKKVATKLIIFHKDSAEFFDGSYEDFLEKIGWEEEEKVDSKKRVKLTRKEAKRIRSEIITQRSRELNPLKKEMDDLEDRIHNLEILLKEKNELIVAASLKQNNVKIKDLSIEINKMEVEMEESFERLEEITCQYEEKEAAFATQLDDIED